MSVEMNNTDEDSLSQELIYLDDPNAYSLLMNNTESLHQYFLYNLGFDTQITQVFCRMATTASVLNSIQSIVTLLHGPAYDSYPHTAQHALIDDCVSKIFISLRDSLLQVACGIALSQFHGLVQCWLPECEGWSVRMHHVTDESEVKAELIKLLVNYYRKMLDQREKTIFFLGRFTNRNEF